MTNSSPNFDIENNIELYSSDSVFIKVNNIIIIIGFSSSNFWLGHLANQTFILEEKSDRRAQP